ncbi:SpoIVB peptidase [Tissierella sp. Yu-01]|uniref:SpoIVB peptidase n=1 Tax=Tissierella sp. Yu-01 TaxID=3035694 RepID=UPI00240DB398|nr:SpoIVB peptidase [Tissierella sp. Yu-01]WFA09702.1 SpoIVB peptidase [Tissierella sp. Yu-01]
MGRFKLKAKYLFIFIIILVLGFTLQLSQILFYPSNFKIIKGENKNLNISFPFSLDNSELGIVDTIYNEGNKSLTLNGIDEGNTHLKVKLLGLIPVKNYNVNVVDRPMVIPGGNAIGVRMNTKGVLVVAVTDVIDINGNRVSPARDAGLKVGDSIIEINGEKIVSSEQVVKILNEIKNEEVEILVLRNKGEFKTLSKAVKCLQDNAYRLGIWVRDKTSGIGTMTYYNEETNTFGALGHGITDMDTGKLLTVEKGLVMNAKISDVEQGKKGTPGEIRGVFYKTDEVLGEIKGNTDFGIYGSLIDNNGELKSKEKIPIGFKEEVELGKAYIYTTLKNNVVEKFEIEIVKLENQQIPDQKSMIIKVTDKQLLEKTGGIVQGMSGSPIIQNDKLIGAITHVFVNDPTKGYGLYIEWMLEELW